MIEKPVGRRMRRIAHIPLTFCEKRQGVFIAFAKDLGKAGHRAALLNFMQIRSASARELSNKSRAFLLMSVALVVESEQST